MGANSSPSGQQAIRVRDKEESPVILFTRANVAALENAVSAPTGHAEAVLFSDDKDE
jgi:hypothetical protein